MERICTISTKKEAARYITECEDRFTADLCACGERILAENPRVLTISGPTCSGKTTVSERLRTWLAKEGKRTVFFSFDDYFRDRVGDNTVTDTPPDYDSPDALDLDTLERVLTGLQRGETVEMPVYDFVTGRRAGTRAYTPEAEDIQIWEGIQAGYPQVEAMLGKDRLALYLRMEPTGQPCFAEKSVPPTFVPLGEDERRLCRRILRDVRCRSSSPSFTLFLWETVRKNELDLVIPQKERADLLLTTSLAYEPYMLRQCLLPYWKTVTEPGLQETAASLAGRLAFYENDLFEAAMVPADSLFREFIGRS